MPGIVLVLALSHGGSALLHGAGASLSTTTTRPRLVYNERLHANNAFTPLFSVDVVEEAAAVFNTHLRSAFLDVRDGLQQRHSGGFYLPYATLES